MVVQTLRIEIQPVSGKGIEVRDDRKTLAVNRLSRRLATRAPPRRALPQWRRFPPVRGGGHAALMRYQGARRPSEYCC